MNIRAPQNQGMVSLPHASHGRGSTDSARDLNQKLTTRCASSIEQGRSAKLVSFPSGENRDPRLRRVAFRGNATIAAISRVAQDVSANTQQAFTVRAGGKREADNDKPQMLRKNLIFY